MPVLARNSLNFYSNSPMPILSAEPVLPAGVRIPRASTFTPDGPEAKADDDEETPELKLAISLDGNQVKSGVTVRGHAFVPLTFQSIVHCALCKDLVWGLTQSVQKGVACSQCDLRMHKRCARKYKMGNEDVTECASVMTRYHRELSRS